VAASLFQRDNHTSFCSNLTVTVMCPLHSLTGITARLETPHRPRTVSFCVSPGLSEPPPRLSAALSLVDPMKLPERSENGGYLA
jgi:hypothetical protein